MASIKRYRKIITEHTTLRLSEPHHEEGGAGVSELCNVGGYTYISVPDTVTLPPQLPEIGLEDVVVTAEVRTMLRRESKQYRLINELVVAKLREKFSQDDENKLNRIATGIALGRYSPTQEELAEIDEFEATVLAARDWGRREKVKIGL